MLEAPYSGVCVAIEPILHLIFQATVVRQRCRETALSSPHFGREAPELLGSEQRLSARKADRQPGSAEVTPELGSFPPELGDRETANRKSGRAERDYATQVEVIDHRGKVRDQQLSVSMHRKFSNVAQQHHRRPR